MTDIEEPTVRGPSWLALKLLEYHGGQTDPIYACGSSWHAGKEVPVSVVRDAMDNLDLGVEEEQKLYDACEELLDANELLDWKPDDRPAYQRLMDEDATRSEHSARFETNECRDEDWEALALESEINGNFKQTADYLNYIEDPYNRKAAVGRIADWMEDDQIRRGHEAGDSESKAKAHAADNRYHFEERMERYSVIPSAHSGPRFA